MTKNKTDPVAITKPAAARQTGPLHNGSVTEPRKLEPLHVVEAGTEDDDAKYPSGVPFAAVVLAAAITLVLVGLDNTIVATAVPAITNHFRTIADIGWYASAYRLTGCSLQFMFGKMYSLFSVKTVFLVSVSIFEVGSLISATAPTSKAFIVGRAISGIGGAGIIQGIFTMVTQSTPVRKRSLYGGLGAGIEILASCAAPMLGGVLTDKLSWRWCFYINLPLGAITLGVVGFFFKNPTVDPNLSLPLTDKINRLDLLGTAIFVPSITALLLALQWGGSKYGWANARIIVLLALFVALLVAFVYLQKLKGDRATLPPRIIMQRSILFGASFSFCNNAALAVIDYYMPIYFQAVKEVSPTQSGIMILPTVAGLMIACVFAGSATSIIGYYAPFMIITSVLTPIATGLLTTLKVDADLTSLICYQALLGFGAGIGFQAPQVAAQTILSQADAPMGIAVVQFMQGLGPAIFVSVAQTLFTQRLTADLGTYAPGLNTTSLETMGLEDLKRHIGAENLKEVLLGYDDAVRQTFYLPVALACFTLVGSLGMEWRSVKKKRE